MNPCNNGACPLAKQLGHFLFVLVNDFVLRG